MRISKIIYCLAGAVVGLITLSPVTASAITLNFASNLNAYLQFNPDRTFQFADGVSARDFTITNSDGSTGTPGLMGNIGGTFTIGIIQLDSLTGEQFAPVTGAGSFSIYDGSEYLTATLDWENISTLGSSGGLNSDGNLSLSGIHYTGLNPDLLDLANAGNAFASLTFNPPNGSDLLGLSNTGGTSAFSGATVADIPAVPESTTMMPLSGVLLVLASRRTRFVAADKNP